MDLPWILLFISILLIAIIAWHSSKFSFVDSFRRLLQRKHKENFDQYTEEVQQDLFDDEDYFEDEFDPLIDEPQPVENKILAINLKAQEGRHFPGEQLVIHLNRAGLRFGDFNIFHFENLFSLASAFEPGTFDLDKLDNMKTSGLTFFMETGHLNDARDAFETMLDTAQHLAEQLKAELFDEKWQPLTEDVLERYYDQIDGLARHCERSEAIQSLR